MPTTLSHLQSLVPAELDAGAVFSGSPSGRSVKGYAAASPFTPTLNPGYMFHESSRDIIVWFIDPSDPLYVFGPTGCGKTSCIKQLAARLNYPVFAVTFSTRTLLRWADLTVRYQPLARQGTQPVIHALDRALGFRASRETRAMLHELVQRVFPQELRRQSVPLCR